MKLERNRAIVVRGYALAGGLGAVLAGIALSVLRDVAGGETIRWDYPLVFGLFGVVPLLVWTGFHLRRERTAAMAFSRVADVVLLRPSLVSRFLLAPEVVRVLAICLLIPALARPRTFRTEERFIEGIDIVIALDLSRSMEERDLMRNRLDAGQRTIREFIRGRKDDRIGLVVFAQAAMVQSPLTLDYDALDRIVADLAIGDVPEMGTAIGDALALSLASLRRSDARSKIVVLVSDGDSNYTTEFHPRAAKALAEEAGVRVFTILVGREDDGGFFGSGHAVNPALLQEIARDTGGRFFRAGSDAQLSESFEEVRSALEMTRRKVTGRVPDRELFWIFAAMSLVLLGLERLMRMTRWRRLL